MTSIAMSEPRESFPASWEFLFVEEAKSQGHTEAYIALCLEYATRLRRNNMPVIFNMEHFAKIVNCPWLTDHYRSIASQYETYYIKKRNGRGTREISSPQYDLKKIQLWIYRNILLRDTSVCSNVFSFLPNGYNDRSRIDIKENAVPHQGHKWLINIDLKDFFGSCRKEQVEDYFKRLGYVDEVAKALSTLCCHRYKLPQGAPTSPMLSNILASQLDIRMAKIADAYKASYTRYADDLTFSGDGDKIIPVQEIYEEIKKTGFRPNYSKTKIRRNGQRQMVTGLTVTHGVNVPKAYRKEVWRELHFLKRFGYENHLIKHQETIGKEVGFYKQWLLGRIMYIRSINPECGNRMLQQFNSIGML